jgi:hypothetical protein
MSQKISRNKMQEQRTKYAPITTGQGIKFLILMFNLGAYWRGYIKIKLPFISSN